MTNQKEIVNNILSRGVIKEVLPDQESFKKRLLDDRPMRIYIGADPTSTALHLSHAKNYMLLEEFRQLGHEAIVLFGDFTARIGDPTDRMSARKQLSAEEVGRNVEKWVDQIRPLMDFDAEDNPPRIVFNSAWLANLTMQEVVELASNMTVQRMLERDMFVKRMEAEKPIHLHEFLYPLMQGYDSVALDIDAELCGTDQTFNALVGRTLLHKLRDKEKFVVTAHMVQNPKTGELMSKSQGTGVFLNTDAFEMFGSIMSLPDEMTEVLLINNTRLPLDQVRYMVDQLHPREAKKQTAREIVRMFHGTRKAEEAEKKFKSLVKDKQPVSDLPEVKVEGYQITVFDLVKNCLGQEVSNSEIRRLIEQGAVEIGGEKALQNSKDIKVPEEGLVVRIGRKRWFRLKLLNSSSDQRSDRDWAS